MKENAQYGDEKLGYNFQARRILDENVADGIYMQMNEERRIALEIRASEKI